MFQINGEEWWAVFVPPDDPILRRPDGDYTYGCCDDMTKTIYISDSIYGDFFWKVLCHEIAHAAMLAYDVMITYEQEELIADIIATFGAGIIEVTNLLFCQIQGGRYC